jgi:broad specificity phosphatase PhoE
VAAALRDYPGAAVFSHFVALNAAVGVATGQAEVMAFRPDHCSRTVFEIDGDRLILVDKGREAESQVL